MDTLSPKFVRRMFIASVVLTILSMAMSAFSVATVLSAPLRAAGDVPQTVGFEGFLADGSGQPLTGTHTLTFYIYDVATGGTSLWSEAQNSIQVSNGLYSVSLGSTSSASATNLVASMGGTPRYVAVKVDAGAEMSPRIQVSSVPFALNASTLRGAAGMIALFEGTQCPNGWQEYANARGRVVVGVPQGGVVGPTSQVGTALANMALRTITDVPAHTHTATMNWGSAGLPTVSTSGTSWNSSKWLGDSANKVIAASAGQITVGTTGISAVDVGMPYVQLMYCQLKP